MLQAARNDSVLSPRELLRCNIVTLTAPVGAKSTRNICLGADGRPLTLRERTNVHRPTGAKSRALPLAIVVRLAILARPAAVLCVTKALGISADAQHRRDRLQ